MTSDSILPNSAANQRRKSSNALRTIGEVASELDLPPHVLRFWESKFSQIKPQKRRGGHRYYRPEDIVLLREIKTLLYDQGYTIKGAQKHLKELKKASGQLNNGNAAPAHELSLMPSAEPHSLDRKERNKLKKALNDLEEVKSLLQSAESY